MRLLSVVLTESLEQNFVEPLRIHFTFKFSPALKSPEKATESFRAFQFFRTKKGNSSKKEKGTGKEERSFKINKEVGLEKGQFFQPCTQSVPLVFKTHSQYVVNGFRVFTVGPYTLNPCLVCDIQPRTHTHTAHPTNCGHKIQQ